MSASNPTVSGGSMLALRDVASGYGQATALADVRLDVAAGEVVAVFGPNGAGKSTLLNTILGLVPARRGSILFDGVEITAWPTHRIVEAGIGYSPQGRGLFPYLSAEANLRLGGYVRRDRAGVRSDIAAFLDRWPVVGARRDRAAGLLSGGEQQVVALGRALMSNPRVLLLDEPSLGLAPALVTQLYRTLAELVGQRRQTVLLVEQNVKEALRVADRVAVLVKGRIVLEAEAASVTAEDIGALYFTAPDAPRTGPHDGAGAA